MNLPPPIHQSPSSDPSSPDDEMALAMGFSSFGNQTAVHAAKRKKYTHSPEDEYSATGGNMLPLGLPRKRQGGKGAEEEVQDIMRDDGGRISGESVEEQEGQGAGMMKGEQEAEAEEEGGSGGDDGRSGEEGVDAETELLLQRQAELLQRINAAPSAASQPPLSPSTHHISSISSSFNNKFDPGSGADTAVAHQSINDINDMNTRRRERPRVEAQDGFEGHTWNEWRKGVRNERGDMAFYDATFVEDPWRGLKAKAGGRGEAGG
ncbi:MAG: hypothetical protein Q9168_001128 [Polycauliona sp. 1 TL-2023]